MNPLITLALQQLPTLIDAIQAHHAQINPTLPPLTDAEVIAIMRQALDSTETKDDLWLAAHGAR